MILRQGHPVDVLFLLVDERLGPVVDAKPAVRIWTADAGWRAVAATVVEVGAGWYSVRLGAEETAHVGQLVLVATADGTQEWRDIHQVMDAAALAVVARSVRAGTES